MQHPVTEERLAARAIALRTRIPKRTHNPQRPGRYELLDMLGLIDHQTGEIIEVAVERKKATAPTSTVHGSSKQVVGQAGMALLRDRSTLPEGLRKLPESRAS
jgi:hypothetical protein